MKMLLIIVLILCLRTQTICSFEDKPYEHKPEFLSQGREILVREGTALELFCEIEDLGGFITSWKLNTTQVLFTGHLRIFEDDNISLNDSTRALTIKNIQMKNAGDYRFDFFFFNNNYVKYFFFNN
jgi:hypothetical protein